MPRDNLLNSACLELFEFIKRENIKPIILHVVESYREKLKDITYVDTFQNLILRYDQMQGSYNAEMDATLFSQDEDGSSRNYVNGQRWQGLKEMESAEEEYFNTSDDEDDEKTQEQLEQEISRMRTRDVAGRIESYQRRHGEPGLASNGATSPSVKPLVDYPDDDDDTMDKKTETVRSLTPENQENQPPKSPKGEPRLQPSPDIVPSTPPERMAEKRRREEDDDEDELVKLSSSGGGVKRRSSNASNASSGSIAGNLLRRKRSFLGSSGEKKPGTSSPPVGDGGKKKMTISLGSSVGKSETRKEESEDA